MGTRKFSRIFFLLIFLVTTVSSHAWVYPEHRKITLLAIQNLSPAFQAQLTNLWAQARLDYASRLSVFAIDATNGRKPKQLDYASWAAIAGDHSCSPANLLQNVLHTNWILKVADIGAALGDGLAKAKTKSQRVNALHYSDMQLIKADNAYASRASKNSIHFLLPRTRVDISAMEYFRQCTKEGADLNALGAYAFYHTNAMQKAGSYAQGGLSETQKVNLLRAAFADEAFALHFLQDAFAAGHVAGSRGNAALQKGTHDHYNEAGLETETWQGKRRVVMGDAYLQDEEAIYIARIIGKSLEFLLLAAKGQGNEIPFTSTNSSVITTPQSFDVCNNRFMPGMNYDTLQLQEIVQQTLLPGLANGKGELPRFRAELGTFIGMSASLNGSGFSGGYGKNQTTAGSIGGLEANLRFGLGLDGVLNQSGDGLVFLQLGWKQESASSNDFSYVNTSTATNSLASAIPARAGYNIRFRLPYCLIPGDLVLASPLLLFAPELYNKMAIAAVNGGLIPWQSGFATGIGRFQFVLGREVGISLYGLRTPKDFLILPTTGNNTLLLEYRSTRIDFPILEYRPLRTFSQDQTSSLMLQINMGVDMPHTAKVLAPTTEPLPELKTIWYLGLRIIFNWRHYF